MNESLHTLKPPMKEIFKRLNNWILKWADTKWGPWALFLCAFADSSIFGLPTPLLFIVLVLLNVRKVYKYVLCGLLGTLSGSIAGYSIGYFVWVDINGEFTGLAQFMLNNIPGFSETAYNKIQLLYARWDFWILLIAAALPLPYKIFSISSGVFDINLFVFCTATLISQGMKFFILAIMTIKSGPQVMKLLEFNWKPIAIIATVCIVIAVTVIKLQTLL
jgi:membrane protein YqaA with SNARE-associated domain